eukprot:gene11751-11836_t
MKCAAGQSSHARRHILWCAPALHRHKTARNSRVIFTGNTGRHCRLDDAGAQLKHSNVFWRKPKRQCSGKHR